MIDGYDSPRGTRLAAEENRRRDDRKHDPVPQQGGYSTEQSRQHGEEAKRGQQQTDQPIFDDWASI